MSEELREEGHHPAQECKCVPAPMAQGILLYGIVSFDYMTKQFYLHAVDRTEERAESHKLAIVNDYRLRGHRARVHIEKFESDHLFAEMMKI